jgi:hypothetical protein
LQLAKEALIGHVGYHRWKMGYLYELIGLDRSETLILLLGGRGEGGEEKGGEEIGKFVKICEILSNSGWMVIM